MLPDLIVHDIIIFFQVQVKDRHQLIDGIVRKFNVLIESALQSGIAVNKTFHRLRVSGNDHDQVISVILHRFQDRIDRFLSEIIRLGNQRISLIDKEHAAQSFLDLLLSLDRSLSHISGNQPGTVNLNQLPLGQNSDLLVELCKDPCDRRFSCTGVPGKYKMQRDRYGFQPRILSALLDLRKICQFPDIMLDLIQPDQVVQRLHRIFLRLFLCLWLRNRLWRRTHGSLDRCHGGSCRSLVLCP